MKKISKLFILIFLSLFFVINFIVLQLSLTINNTIFSSHYFDRVFNSHITSSKIDIFINNFIENIDKTLPYDSKDTNESSVDKPLSIEEQARINSYKESLKSDIDVNWFKTEVPLFIKDSFAYATNNNSQMPILNIKPLKTSIINILANQMVLEIQGNAKTEVDNLIQQIEHVNGGLLKDGKANPLAVDMILQSDFGKKLNDDKVTAAEIIEKLAIVNNEKNNYEETFNYITRKVIYSSSGFNTMKDKLDFNLLFKNLYGANNNPITAGRSMINDIRISLLITIAIIFVCLSIIIMLVLFNIKKILRWYGSLSIIGSIVCFVPICFYKTNSNIISNATDKINKDGMDLSFIREWITSYIDEISNYILIQSIVIVILGIGMITYSNMFHKRNEDKKLLNNKISILSVRIVAIILLIGIIILSILNFVRIFNSEVKNYNNVNNSFNDVSKEININKTLGKTLNTNFFDSMESNK